jgi:hypothetical protein
MAGEMNIPLLILEAGAIALDFIVGIMLTRKTITIGKGSMRKYYLCVTCFFFAHGTYLITYIIYLFTNNGMIFDVGISIVLASIVLIVTAIEFTIFTRLKHVFTIFGWITVILIMIDAIVRFNVKPRIMIVVQFFANPIIVAFILITYLNAARRARGSARKNAILMLIAIVIFSIGELGQSQVAVLYIPSAEFYGTILMDVAIVMLYYGFMHLSIWKREGQQQIKETNGGATTKIKDTGQAE